MVDCVVDKNEFVDKLENYDIFATVEDQGRHVKLELRLDDESGAVYTFYLGYRNLKADLDRVMEVIYGMRYEIAENTSKTSGGEVDAYLYAIGLMFDRYREFKLDLGKGG